MKRLSVCCWLLLTASAGLLRAQSALPKVPLVPDWRTVQRPEWKAPRLRPPGDFVKHFNLQTFGIGRGPVLAGYDNPARLSGLADGHGPNGLECPQCIVRPVMDRTRYTLPAFGGQLSWAPRSGRFQMDAGAGGVNAWKPDYALADHTRTTSFNNQWLTQVYLRARFALDAKRRFWLGGDVRKLRYFGAQQGYWTSVGSNVTYYFGR